MSWSQPHPRASGILAAATVAAMCAGCGSSRCSVNGTVTHQGKLLGHGTITFLAHGNPPGPMAGALIQNGCFDIPAAQGLEPGKYKVAISAAGGVAPRTPDEIAAGASARAMELIPAKYNSETTLSVVIIPGANFLELKLE